MQWQNRSNGTHKVVIYTERVAECHVRLNPKSQNWTASVFFIGKTYALGVYPRPENAKRVCERKLNRLIDMRIDGELK